MKFKKLLFTLIIIDIVALSFAIEENSFFTDNFVKFSELEFLSKSNHEDSDKELTFEEIVTRKGYEI